MSPARGWTRVAAGPAEISVIREGAGPLVVMLPSRGRGSEDYDDVAEAIAGAGYLVLRPQPRGMHGSTGPMDGLTLHDFAADIAAVIAAEQAGRGVIVGHAFGNFVARAIAADHPRLVRAVVLAAAGAKDFPRELSLLVTRSSDMTVSEPERLAYLRTVFFAPGNDPACWLTGWDEQVSRSQRAAADRTPQSDWWGAGTAPLLDLIAGADPFRPASSYEELRLAFPGRHVDISVVPGVSHAMLPERPSAVAQAIIGWLRSLPRDDSRRG